METLKLLGLILLALSVMGLGFFVGSKAAHKMDRPEDE